MTLGVVMRKQRTIANRVRCHLGFIFISSVNGCFTDVTSRLKLPKCSDNNEKMQ